MTDEREKRLMLRFLELNYPVSRIKINGRFKRAIVLENDAAFILGNNSNLLQLQYNLFETLLLVFNCDEATARGVLYNYLNLN